MITLVTAPGDGEVTVVADETMAETRRCHLWRRGGPLREPAPSVQGANERSRRLRSPYRLMRQCIYLWGPKMALDYRSGAILAP